MRQGFRQTMAWLHTWSGLVAAWILYFVFVTGTAGYFQIEISRWMRPELPLMTPRPPAEDMLAAAEAFLRREAAAADIWSIELPYGRHGDDLNVSWTFAPRDGGRQTRSRSFDWESGTFREAPKTRDTGGGFALYRLHHTLHYIPRVIAEPIVAFCTMFALVAIVSGLVIHRKIFADFFTFRPGAGQRSWLDAHNLTSVIALPFIVMIVYSGLVFVMEDYITGAVKVLYGSDRQARGGEIFPFFDRPRPEYRPAAMLPISGFLPDVHRHWGAETTPRRVIVFNPGDASAQVQFWHSGMETVRQEARRKVNFSAVDGRVLGQITDARSAPVHTQSVLYGLHEGLFAGPLLRWLFFGSGLLGCAMIATGLVLWTTKRRAKAARGGTGGKEAGGNGGWGFGHDLVERVNIGTIAGLPIAIALYFWANRLLPVALPDRATWEMHGLFIAWGVMFLHATVRPARRAWSEQFAGAAVAFGLLPVLNALTTERHLGVTLPAGDWGLAGFDLTMLVFGIVFGMMAVRVGVAGRVPTTQASRHDPIVIGGRARKAS
jgi:uncharacterized iron-regulated membrane protein